MAVYPVQAGHPDYSSTGTAAYIPAIYSALLIKKFYPQTVFGAISNTDYEGDIKSSGDTVNIRTRPTIETFTYKKGMVLPVQNPTNPYVQLKIDQGEGFSFALDRVDEFQSDLKLMSIWAEDAAQQMKQVIDRKVLATIAAAGGGVTASGPTLTTPKLIAGGSTTQQATIPTVTVVGAGLGVSGAGVNLTDATRGDDLITQILYYGQLLDEQNAPEEGRYVILPPKFMQALKNTNSKLAQTYVTGDATSPLRNGKVGNIDRFEIYSSNNLASGAANSTTAILFGQKYATTFATQITESRTIENPFAFGKMMQGLQVYGFQIIKPELIGVDFVYM
jgi:hypothetical protein